MAELRAEGYTFEGDAPPEEAPAAKPEPEKTEPAEPEKESQAPEAPKADEADGADDGKPAEPEKKQTERTSRYVPVNKHNEERHKRQAAERAAQEAAERAKALEAELESLRSRPQQGTKSTLERLSAIAEKHGVDPAFMQDFAESLKEEIGQANHLPQDIVSRLERFEAAQKEAEIRELSAKQDLFFEAEFAKVCDEFPGLAARKEDLKRVAFSEGTNNVPLRYLALEYVHQNPDIAPKGRASAERQTGIPRASRPDGSSSVDYSNITEAEFAAMSDAEVDKYHEWLKASGKLR